MNRIVLFSNALIKPSAPCRSHKFPESIFVDIKFDALNGDCHVCWFNH